MHHITKHIHNLKNIGLFLLVWMMFLSSCEKTSVLDCFNSTGQIQKVEREIRSFKAIVLNDNVNLKLRKANKNRLVLEAGSNLMKKIKTDVNDDSVLVIRNENSCNWVRSYDKPITVYLDFVDLDSLEYRSVGDVYNDDTLFLDTLKLEIWEGAGKIDLLVRTKVCRVNLHYGTADVILRGQSLLAYYYQLGAGRIDARGFKSGKVFMRNWSSNDMYIWATDELSVEIKSLGNVYYKGQAVISSQITGQGQLIRLNE